MGSKEDKMYRTQDFIDQIPPKFLPIKLNFKIKFCQVYESLDNINSISSSDYAVQTCFVKNSKFEQ